MNPITINNTSLWDILDCYSMLSTNQPPGFLSKMKKQLTEASPTLIVLSASNSLRWVIFLLAPPVAFILSVVGEKHLFNHHQQLLLLPPLTHQFVLQLVFHRSKDICSFILNLAKAGNFCGQWAPPLRAVLITKVASVSQKAWTFWEKWGISIRGCLSGDWFGKGWV